MKISRRNFCLLMAGACCTGVLAACGSSSSSTASSSAASASATASGEVRDELIFVNYRDIRDLNPHLYAGEMYAQSILYDTLVSITANGYEGCLAESWDISEDGCTYTFHIRPNVLFSDGEKCDANAILANFNAILENRERHTWLEMMNLLVGVSAPDENTFVIEMSEPYYPMLTELGCIRPFAMISPNCMINGSTKDGVNGHIGTGPYVLTDFVTDEYAVFERNENYWGETPAIRKITVKVIPDNQTRIMALESGEIDLIFGKNMIDADAISQYLDSDKFTVGLLDMKVSTQAVDVHTTSLADIPEFDQYKTVVVLISDLDALGKRLIDLMNWVKDGGSVLFAMAPQKTTYFDAISPKLGILSSSWENKIAESIVPTEEFMLGGGQRYEFSDPFESSLSVSLREEATVYASTGDEGVPLVWGTKSGAGRVVVDNIGVYDKIMRGIYAASFSLLCDAAAYPVINSSVFYLDDFPSPVPGGDGTYIRRDYRMSIADFYSKVWWPDLVKLAQQYSIRFTGVMIENYEDDTQSTPVRQPDTQQFRYYGSLLLQQGGEVGFHGYNHQPLVLPDTDYKDLYSYRQWPSEDAIVAAMNELIDFQKTVLPNTEGSVYVPPSNILSAAGRKVLGSKVTRIRTIASTYFEDGTSLPYVQEFGVASDGIVEQPRIVSGGMVGDTYMRLVAMSELNMHYVSIHFMHPDDLLDVDRGAAEGWETYKGGLKDYLKWLSAAAPDLRRQTGTECSAAIQRYAQLTVTLDSTDTAWTLHLGNFVDEAWLFFRANEGTPGKVTGGELTRLTGNLYLLKANADTVRIEKKGA